MTLYVSACRCAFLHYNSTGDVCPAYAKKHPQGNHRANVAASSILAVQGGKFLGFQIYFECKITPQGSRRTASEYIVLWGKSSDTSRDASRNGPLVVAIVMPLGIDIPISMRLTLESLFYYNYLYFLSTPPILLQQTSETKKLFDSAVLLLWQPAKVSGTCCSFYIHA
eukprot:jgi/Antlo1/506/1718